MSVIPSKVTLTAQHLAGAFAFRINATGTHKDSLVQPIRCHVYSTLGRIPGWLGSINDGKAMLWCDCRGGTPMGHNGSAWIDLLLS